MQMEFNWFMTESNDLSFVNAVMKLGVT